MEKTIFNILFDSSTGLYFKMNLYDYLHGGYLVGTEKRNPFLSVIDSCLSESDADKKIKILNQTDMEF